MHILFQYRMRTRISASNKSVDTVEAPWNVPTHLVHQGTDPFNMPSENSIGTQTEPFIVSCFLLQHKIL